MVFICLAPVKSGVQAGATVVAALGGGALCELPSTSADLHGFAQRSYRNCFAGTAVPWVRRIYQQELVNLANLEPASRDLTRTIRAGRAI